METSAQRRESASSEIPKIADAEATMTSSWAARNPDWSALTIRRLKPASRVRLRRREPVRI